MSRLREVSRANTARGAAHFLRRDGGAGALLGGATAQLTVRADSGFYGATLSFPPAGGKWMAASPSPSAARQPAGPDRGDTGGGLDSHSVSLDGRRRRCCPETTSPRSRPSRTPAPCGSCPAGEPRRPVSQLALPSPDTAIRLHHRPQMGRPWNSMVFRSSPPRRGLGERHTHGPQVRVGLNHMPSGRFAANGAWLRGPSDGA